MPGKAKNTISDQLKAAKVALTNSLADAEIQGYVAKYGYDTTRLNEGQAIYLAADSAVSAAAAATGAQKQTTEDLLKAQKTALTAYQDLSTVAKAVLKGNGGALTKLGLDRPMPRTTAGFTAAGYILFDNATADPDIKSKVGTRGYTDEKLATERAKIVAFDEADDHQEAAKGANQQASNAEASAMKKLNDWMAEYRKIAKIALREKKNLLEKLGIPVRNTKTKAQRNAPMKSAATRAAKKNPPGK